MRGRPAKQQRCTPQRRAVIEDQGAVRLPRRGKLIAKMGFNNVLHNTDLDIAEAAGAVVGEGPAHLLLH